MIEHPQFIASSRHISMDAISIVSHAWDKLSFQLQLLLVGIPATVETYWFHVPDHFILNSSEFDGGKILSQSQDEQIVSINIQFDEKKATLIIKFGLKNN
jgi:hypothetical protein